MPISREPLRAERQTRHRWTRPGKPVQMRREPTARLPVLRPSAALEFLRLFCPSLAVYERMVPGEAGRGTRRRCAGQASGLSPASASHPLRDGHARLPPLYRPASPRREARRRARPFAYSSPLSGDLLGLASVDTGERTTAGLAANRPFDSAARAQSNAGWIAAARRAVGEPGRPVSAASPMPTAPLYIILTPTA